MPQQHERELFPSEHFVSDIDYSEARNVLDLTTSKQKQLRRQRSQALYTQLLLKRTYAHVCDLLDSDCTIRKCSPLSSVDTNKRRLYADDDDSDELKSVSKKLKDSRAPSYDLAHDLLQYLSELNAVKVTARY